MDCKKKLAEAARHQREGNREQDEDKPTETEEEKQRREEECGKRAMFEIDSTDAVTGDMNEQMAAPPECRNLKMWISDYSLPASTSNTPAGHALNNRVALYSGAK